MSDPEGSPEPPSDDVELRPRKRVARKAVRKVAKKVLETTDVERADQRALEREVRRMARRDTKARSKAERTAHPKRGPKAPKAERSTIKVGLSTSSVYPLGAQAAFDLARRLGYDGVEIMVWTDPVSQDPDALTRLSARYDVPILAIHAPTLLVTQRVWGKDPWAKISGAVDLAVDLGVDTVVAHPPFRWQGRYAEEFVEGTREISQTSGVAIAVENMYPWRARNREIPAYLPGWDPTDHDYEHFTLDLSHAATAGADSLELARRMGDRLRHVHLTDGSGSPKDEHLVPGEGNQPCVELLAHLVSSGFAGHVVAEINTRKARSPAEREDLLTASLWFARHYLDNAVVAGSPSD